MGEKAAGYFEAAGAAEARARGENQEFIIDS
jgi:hypothetical protein